MFGGILMLLCLQTRSTVRKISSGILNKVLRLDLCVAISV